MLIESFGTWKFLYEQLQNAELENLLELLSSPDDDNIELAITLTLSLYEEGEKLPTKLRQALTNAFIKHEYFIFDDESKKNDMDYKIKDGMLHIDSFSDLTITKKCVDEAGELRFAFDLFDGIFDCSEIGLKTLKNVPNKVYSFICYGNEITSLAGSPEVKYTFDVGNNKLTTLEGGPTGQIREAFLCDENSLTSLAGAPELVDYFDCSYNTGLKSFDVDELPLVRYEFHCVDVPAQVTSEMRSKKLKKNVNKRQTYREVYG